MSRHLSTRNISSKSTHAFLSNLAHRQTDRQTDKRTRAKTVCMWKGIRMVRHVYQCQKVNLPAHWCTMQCEMWVYYYNNQMVEKILWADNLRHLGVFITAFRKFCCSLSNAKKFYRAFNCVFGKVVSVASAENVIVELLNMTCLPCLYCGLKACRLIQSQLR